MAYGTERGFGILPEMHRILQTDHGRVDEGWQHSQRAKRSAYWQTSGENDWFSKENRCDRGVIKVKNKKEPLYGETNKQHQEP